MLLTDHRTRCRVGLVAARLISVDAWEPPIGEFVRGARVRPDRCGRHRHTRRSRPDTRFIGHIEQGFADPPEFETHVQSHPVLFTQHLHNRVDRPLLGRRYFRDQP